jgi:hypothetical protein
MQAAVSSIHGVCAVKPPTSISFSPLPSSQTHPMYMLDKRALVALGHFPAQLIMRYRQYYAHGELSRLRSQGSSCTAEHVGGIHMLHNAATVRSRKSLKCLSLAFVIGSQTQAFQLGLA